MKRCITTELTDAEFKQIITDAVTDILQQTLQKLNLQQATTEQAVNNNLLSRKQVSKLLGVSYPTLSRLQRDGKLKFIILGGNYRYRQKDILKLIN